jgi:TldD protein
VIDPAAVRSTLATLTGHGDLFAEDTLIATCTSSNGEPGQLQVRHHQGTGLRQIGRGLSRHVHWPGIGEQTLHQLARAFRSGDVERFAPPEALAGSYADEPIVDEIVGLAREVAGATRDCDAGRISALVTVRMLRSRVLVARSDGPLLQETRIYTKVNIEAIARAGSKVRRSQRQHGAPLVADLRRGGLHLALAREAAEAALARLDAVAPPVGELTVILGPGGPATLLHEACGHALEADLAQQRSSAYHGCLGTQVAAPEVTLIDDPSSPGHAPFYQFDDEGQPAEATVLIERGELRALLHTLATAQQLGVVPNGKAVRPALWEQPHAAASNIYLRAGDAHPAELRRAIRRGLIVEGVMRPGRIQSSNGTFTLVVHGQWVEAGVPVRRVSGVPLSANIFKLLRGVRQSGADLHFSLLADGAGAPSVLVEHMQVG